MMNIIENIDKILTNNLIIDIFLSGSFNKEISKIEIRRSDNGFLVIRHSNKQVFHQNIRGEELKSLLLNYINMFKQTVIYTQENDFQIFNNHHNFRLISKAASKKFKVIANNKEKNYILKPGSRIDFLVALKIFDSNYQVVPTMQKKFKQINRFLEIVSDLDDLFKDKIRIVDFGCGKSYLTFAIYYYFNYVRKLDVDIIGVDIKKEVIDNCQKLKMELGYKNLSFICGDIKDLELTEIDLVVSLHACDLATDYALEKSIRWQAKAILAVPCCQHEINQNCQLENFYGLNEHGIIKERISALITDVIRAKTLETMGYNCQIMEFINIEDTAKNLLIRARKNTNKDVDKAKKELETLLNSISFKPKIINLLEDFYRG